MGFTVTANGLQASPAKKEAVQQWPRPRTVKEVQSFLGFCNYYRKFVQHCKGAIAAPLTALTRDTQAWRWTKVEQDAFEELKNCLISAPTLIIPNPDLPFTLMTDASNIAIGAVLTQDHGHGQQPIAFFSKKLNDAQRKYEVQERELLAVKEAVTEWRSYLEGQQFTIKTDNCNLLTMSTNSVQRNDKVIPWLQYLANFNYIIYVVEHVKGTENLADILTRCADYVINALQFPVTEQPFFDAVRLGYQLNPVHRTRYTCTADGLWINDKGHVVIPENKELQSFLIHKAHSTRL